MSRFPARLIFLATSIVLIGACSMGKTKYQCPRPDSVACKSAKEMYEATDAPGEAGIKGARALMTDEKGRPLDAGTKRASVLRQGDALVFGDASPTSNIVIPDPGATVPVRMPAEVMRVWISPWEDSEGSLHLGGRVFTEIVARKWSFGNLAVAPAHAIQPLQIEAPATDPATPRPAAPPPARATTNPLAQSARRAPSSLMEQDSLGAKPNDKVSSGGGG